MTQVNLKAICPCSWNDSANIRSHLNPLLPQIAHCPGTCKGSGERTRQGPIERATKRKRKEPSSRAGKTKAVWVGVFLSFFERDVEIVQHPLLSV